MAMKNEPVDKFAAKRVRHGKTLRDRESGAWARRMQNRDQLAHWSNDKKSAFPSHVCSGKGNSSKAYKAKHGKAVK